LKGFTKESLGDEAGGSILGLFFFSMSIVLTSAGLLMGEVCICGTGLTEEVTGSLALLITTASLLFSFLMFSVVMIGVAIFSTVARFD
jgi:hypothetical protein